MTARHSFCRSVFFSKSGCGSDNFSYHYNAHRLFDASFLGGATIGLIIPRTLLTIRDFKIRYGEVLLRLRKVNFTSGDVSTCVAVRLSSRSMLFCYGKVLRLAIASRGEWLGKAANAVMAILEEEFRISRI